MARFFIVAAALASLLLALIGNASSYRTTVTTVEFDDQSGGRGRSGSCQEQIRRAELGSCEQYVSQSRPRIALRGTHSSRGDQGHAQQCCQQIRQVDRQCQCDALRSMIEEQTQQQQRRRPEQEETTEVMRRATEIQRQCGLPDCQSQSIWF
uniref:Bifunctional inhibitor/plant lipid transfer protein/seed storage helical domain-containing protein n=1 Tax=Salix viminalis TaxID=40686 RepID=A0A6N2MIR2_SALVM